MLKTRLKRIPTIHHFAVHDVLSGEVFGFLGNITIKGMMLFMQAPVEPQHGRAYPLRMKIPGGAGNREILVQARSVWCRHDPHCGLYAAGFELDGLGESVRKEIRSLIEEFGSRG